MTRAARALRLLPLLALLGTAQAQSVSAEEIAFWQAVQQSNRIEEYRAYLLVYPNGIYAPIARLRVNENPPAPPAPQTAYLRVATPQVERVQGIALDVDATPLQDGSNHRLATMPATAPDAIADVDALVADSTPIPTGRLHLTIPPGPPGSDEVRLYYIPRYASAFTVGARAPVTVGPAIPGAVLGRDLVREAKAIGPLRFTAAHRDRPMLVEAAFLRIRPETEWDIHWFPGGLPERVGTRIVMLSLGVPGVLPDTHGSFDELVCALPASTPAAIDRFAAMQVGEPLLLQAIPTVWGDSLAGPLVLDRCTLAG